MDKGNDCCDSPRISRRTILQTGLVGTIASVGPLQTSLAILYADRFAGATADVKVNGAISGLGSGGGTVDCRALIGSQTFNAPVVVPMGVSLLLPPTGTWTFKFNDPNAAAIQVQNGARLLGFANGVVGKFQIEPASSSVMDSLVSSDLSNVGTGNGCYVEMNNFSLNYAGSGASIANGLLHIVNVFDGSLIKNVLVQTQQAGRSSAAPAYGLLVNGACCCAAFENVVVNSNSANHNVPLAIIDPALFGSAGIGFFSCSFGHPGVGMPIIRVDQSASAFVDDGAINFYNLQGESNQNTDTATSLFQLVSGTVKVFGGRFFHLLKSPTAYCFSVASASDTALDVRGFEYKAVNKASRLNAISNAITGQNVVTDSSGNVPSYLSSLGYQAGAVINQQVAGAMPNAEANSGLVTVGNTQSLFGSDDLMIQLSPSAGSAWCIVEGLGSVGFALSTFGSHPVTIKPNRSNAATFLNGLQLGSPGGGDKGTGTLNVANGYYANGTAGVSAGPLTSISSIAVVDGLVTSLSGTSDERLKESTPYKVGLEAVLAINPVRYKWNNEGQEHTGLDGQRSYVGFLAQDVQRAIPEATTSLERSKEGTEYLCLDDRAIIAALVNAVKELSRELTMLRANVKR